MCQNERVGFATGRVGRSLAEEEAEEEAEECGVVGVMVWMNHSSFS